MAHAAPLVTQALSVPQRLLAGGLGLQAPAGPVRPALRRKLAVRLGSPPRAPGRSATAANRSPPVRAGPRWRSNGRPEVPAPASLPAFGRWLPFAGTSRPVPVFLGR